MLSTRTSPRSSFDHAQGAQPIARVGADASGSLPSFGAVLSLAGAGLGAYHGYRRNDGSVGWAIGWGLLGGAFPIITTGVAFAQGFGERG